MPSKSRRNELIFLGLSALSRAHSALPIVHQPPHNCEGIVAAEKMYGEPDDEDLAAEEQAAAQAAWEKHYQAERTWEDLEEDETGRLRMGAGDKSYREKRRKIALVAANSHVCKGMIRFLYVVLDLSQAVNEEDMRPSRLAVISALMYKFFREFFSQNPLSQLGLVVTRNGIAERLTGCEAPFARARFYFLSSSSSCVYFVMCILSTRVSLFNPAKTTTPRQLRVPYPFFPCRAER